MLGRRKALLQGDAKHCFRESQGIASGRGKALLQGDAKHCFGETQGIASGRRKALLQETQSIASLGMGVSAGIEEDVYGFFHLVIADDEGW